MSGQLGTRPAQAGPASTRRSSAKRGGCWPRSNASTPASAPRFGDELLERIRKEPRNAHWLWALSRLGARQPLYGPLNGVVSAPAAERWIERLLSVTEMTADRAQAIAHIGARTGDAGRDVSEAVAAAAAERLSAAGFTDAA